MDVRVDTAGIAARAVEDAGVHGDVFARRAGVHPNTVYRWTTGRTVPTVAHLMDALEKNGLDPGAYGLEDVSRVPSSPVELPSDEILARLDRLEELVRCCIDAGTDLGARLEASIDELRGGREAT